MTLQRREAYCFYESLILIQLRRYHDLFVSLDYSLTSYRFTTRSEQLTKCCEPLQKLSVRLGTCKTSLNPPVIIYFGSLQGDFSVVILIVLCLGVDECVVCT